ncbi:hypothetical protein HAX54_052140 [Datura stramonium]|uniref:Uncharacterized protein n=1 Tax=Datura stramonium TaxID=4076 RepID=A0ABS8RRI5_DATST|nr:hypothetical protein [Datura stramonium]
MGASNQFSSSQRPIDEITTVSERVEGVDPILERLKSLKIAAPILKSPPAESSLTDILSGKHPPLRIKVISIYYKQFSIPPGQEDVGALSYLTPLPDVNVWNECLSYIIHGVRTLVMLSHTQEEMRWNFLVKLKLHRCTAAPLQHMVHLNPVVAVLDGDMRRSFKAGCVDPKVLLELFSVYRQWQEEKAKKICKRQEEIENKIEVADALAVKLLQRFNYSVSAMKTTSQHLSEGIIIANFWNQKRKEMPQGITGFPIMWSFRIKLNVELGVLKGRLTEVISNCDALCKRIDAEGPESLRSSIKPFTAAASSDTGSNSSSIHILQAETDEKQ